MNRKTKGGLSKVTLQVLEEEKRLLKHFAAPLEDHEKGSFRHLTKENVQKFFGSAPKTSAENNPVVQVASNDIPSAAGDISVFSPLQFCELVRKKINDASFAEEHCNKKAPLAMMAAA